MMKRQKSLLWISSFSFLKENVKQTMTAAHWDGSFHSSRIQQDIWLHLHDCEESLTEQRLLGPTLERYRKSNRFRINLKQGSHSRQKSITSCKKKHGLERKTELWKWPRTTPRVPTAVYVQQNTAKGLQAGQSQPHSIYSLRRSSLEEAE